MIKIWKIIWNWKFFMFVMTFRLFSLCLNVLFLTCVNVFECNLFKSRCSRCSRKRHFASFDFIFKISKFWYFFFQSNQFVLSNKIETIITVHRDRQTHRRKFDIFFLNESICSYTNRILRRWLLYVEIVKIVSAKIRQKNFTTNLT